MTVRDKLIANNRLVEVETGIFIVAKQTWKSEPYEALVSDGYGLGGDPIYMRRITDLNTEINDEIDKIFLIMPESWRRMTTTNLFLKKDK